MKRLIAFVQRYFKYLFYFALFGCLVSINAMHRNSEALHTRPAPKGIISLELAKSNEAITQVVDSWKFRTLHEFEIRDSGAIDHPYSALSVAIRQTHQDFFFIFFYTLLFCVLLIFLSRRVPIKLLLSLALTAGIMDILENMGMLEALHGHHPDAWTIWLPSTIKWILVGLLSLYILMQGNRLGHTQRVLSQLSAFLSSSAGLIVRFRIVAFTLAFLFLLLYLMDQGQDLLLVINSSPLGPILLMSSITIMALINWYLPKYYEHLRRETISVKGFLSGNWNKGTSEDPRGRDVARLLGALSFLLPAVAILHALQQFAVDYWLNDINPLLILVAIMVFYRMALDHRWVGRVFAPGDVFLWKRFWTVIGTIFLLIIVLGFWPGNRAPGFLAFLSLDLFLLSLAFLIVTTLRTCLPKNSVLASVNITPLVLVPATVLALAFVVVNLAPGVLFFNKDWKLLTLPVIICALIFYTLAFTLLLIAGKRFNIRFTTLLLITIVLIAALSRNSLHQVKLVPARAELSRYQPLEQYARSWFMARRDEIDSFNKHNRPYPVYLVNAYGGGIRAAAWTSLAVLELDSCLWQNQQAVSNEQGFEHYVFSYSGASGGTIGASVLCAARYTALGQQQRDTFFHNWQSIFENDYLTPVAACLMGRDIWNSSVGLHLLNDRAYIQERTWEHQLYKYGIDYGQPLSSYWYDSSHRYYEIPLLFANTYSVDSGLKGIAAPVQLGKDFTGTIYVPGLIAQKDSGLKLSTAAFLSARFPYISPTAKFSDYYHFLDGGLKENSGAETSREIMAVLDRTWKQLQKEDTTYCHRYIQFQLLSLPNTVQGNDSLLKAANPLELTAPLSALMNNWIGNTTRAEQINVQNTAQYAYVYHSLRPRALRVNDFTPVLPLGWQISSDALTQMKRSIETQRDSLKIILNPILAGRSP